MAIVSRDSQVDGIRVEEVERRPQKTRYIPPTLKVYGTVVEFTKGSSTQNSDSGNSRKSHSDRAVKENIIRVGEHPLGIGLYLFDYKPSFREACGHGRQFGVMADEVESVMPEAVRIDVDGYMMVDYAMLGIKRAIH
jgi:hypothetical protein